MAKTVTDDGLELTVEREADCYWGEEPDPEWDFVDAAGHRHRYSKDLTVSTLERVVTGNDYCPECNYEWETTELRCKQCAAAVHPGTRHVLRHTAGPVSISGRMSRSHPQAEALELAMYHGTKLEIPLPKQKVTLTGVVVTGIDGTGWVEFYADGIEKPGG